MYQIGELVQYETSGVCKVEQIVQGVPGLQKDISCYLLIPVGKRDGRIYTPVNNERVRMRRILSGEEVKALMENVSQIPCPVINNEKQCESIYREELYSMDCYRWVGLLKTLYARRAARIAIGKKVTATDERYLKYVEDRLKEELSLIIGQEAAVSELEKLSNAV